MISSLKETFNLIRKNKGLIILLFIIQIVFFTLVSKVNIVYQTKILESASLLISGLEQQDLSEEELAKDILTKGDVISEAGRIQAAYRDVVNSIFFLLFLSFAIFAVFNGSSWALTNNIFGRKTKFLKYLLDFAIAALAYFIAMLLLVYFAFKIFVSKTLLEQGVGSSFVPLFVMAIVLYFMFISFSLIGKMKLIYTTNKTLRN